MYADGYMTRSLAIPITVLLPAQNLRIFPRTLRVLFAELARTASPSSEAKKQDLISRSSPVFYYLLFYQDKSIRILYGVYHFRYHYPTIISQRAFSSSQISSSTLGTLTLPALTFLILIIGVVTVASTSDFSKARSAPCISQLISLSPLQ